MAEDGFRVKVGDKVTFSKVISHEDLVKFAEASGDTNPIHLNDDYAGNTRFGKRIAHGMLSAGFISTAVGIKLPQPNETTIYLSQSLRFMRPVFIGDTVTVEAEVTAVDPERRRVTLSTVCVNQNQEQVVTGEALVLLDRYPYSSGG